MYEYGCRRSAIKSKGLQLHSVLRQYKRFQQQKQILQNRINIMHNNQVKNQNKSKIIEKQLEKMRCIQKQRKRQLQMNNKQIQEQLNEDQDKKRLIISKVKQEKKNIQNSKKKYQQYIMNNYRRARSQSKINSKRIAEKRQEQLGKKRKIKQDINHSQQLGRTKVSTFRNHKLQSFRQYSTSRLMQQIQMNQTSRQELSVLKKLQKEMIVKYSESINSLKTSRANIKKTLPIRV